MPPQEPPKQGRHSPNGRRIRTGSLRDTQRANERGREEECPNEEFEQDPAQVENPPHTRRRPRDFRRTGSFFAQHEEPNNNTTVDQHAAERNDYQTEQGTEGNQLPPSDQFAYRNPFTPNPPPNQRDHYYQNQSFQAQPNMAPMAGPYGQYAYSHQVPNYYSAAPGPAYAGFPNYGNNYYEPNPNYATKDQWGQQWVPPQYDQYGREIPKSNTTKPRREPSTKKKPAEARRKSGSSTDSSTSSKTLTELRREIKKDVMRSVENRLLRRDVEALSRKGTSSLSDASHENPSHEVILRLLNLLESEKFSDTQSMENRRASMPPEAFGGLGYGPRQGQTRSTRASWDGSAQPSPPRRSPEFPEGKAQLSVNEILQLLRSYRSEGPSDDWEERPRFTRPPPTRQFEEWLNRHDHQHPPTRQWGDSTDEERGVPGGRRPASTRPYASGATRDPRTRVPHPHPHHPNECPCCQHAARYGDVI